MGFFTRRLTPAMDEVRRRLAEFIGARPDDLVLVENATAGMNVVAANFPLAAGDEVLVTDHEYVPCCGSGNAGANRLAIR